MGTELPLLKLFFILNICLLTVIIVYLHFANNNRERGRYEIKNSEPRVGFLFSYEDLEHQLCENKSEFDLEQKMEIKRDSNNCPRRGIVSFITGGRTGNQMWEYASVWAVSRKTGLDAYIPDCIKSKLDEIFENLSLPSFNKIARCPMELNTFVKGPEEWAFENQSIILPRYILLPELVLPRLQDVAQEFRFNKGIRDKAKKTLFKFVEKLPSKNYTFIGVHVRRTDYISYLQRKYNSSTVRPNFFQNAMSYYKQKYPNCLYVFVSDDPTWCFKEFGKRRDVFIASYKSQNSPAVDLAIMAACNHTIFDYGTFGEWGSILAGGEVVFNNMTQNVMRGIGNIMKNWHLMF